MAHVNYQFEKRKRDLEKEQKQEAKRQRKAERKNRQASETVVPPTQPSIDVRGENEGVS